MAYQSLYRAHRPRQFSEMIGQDAVRRALSNQAATGRIAHAYLFCGSRGTGKTSAARIMAMAINCLSPTKGDPCLVCDNCKALHSETTLDVFEMDAASNSRVEEIREMLSKTDYPPQFVKYKVYIIDEVHMLSNAAFNALLKTLEEPPPYMVFILATTEPQKLPATILSRCQRFDFGRIPEREMVTRLRLALQDGTTADDDALQLIAAAAEGSMRDAWSLMDMCLGSQSHLDESVVREALGTVSRAFLFEFMDALGKGDTRTALELTAQLMQAGRDVQVFLREFATHARQLLSIKWTGKPLGDISGELLATFLRQAEELSAQVLLHILDLAMQAEQDTRWASSPRAVLELFALKTCQGKLEVQSPNANLQATAAPLAPTAQKANARQQPVAGTSAVPAAKTPSRPVPDQEEDILDALPPNPWLPPDFLQPDQAPPALAKAMPAVPPLQKPILAVPDVEPVMTDDAGSLHASVLPQPPVAQEIHADSTETEPVLLPETPVAPLIPDIPLAQDTATTPSTTPKEAWNRMLTRLEKEQAGIYSLLSQGRYGGFENNTFTIAMSRENEMYASLLADERRADVIATILSQEMGHPVQFIAGNPLQRPIKTPQNEQEDSHLQALSQAFGRDKIRVQRE